MNEPQTPEPAPDEQAGLLASIQRQITFMLLVLIVLSGTVTAYLCYQARVMAHQLEVLQPQARVVFANYQKNLPHIEKFVQVLIAYGQRHPDFQPILKKYGIPLTLSATNSASKPAISKPVISQPTVSQPKK